MEASDRVGEQVRFLRKPSEVRLQAIRGVVKRPIPDNILDVVGQIVRHHKDRVKVEFKHVSGEYVTAWMPESDVIYAGIAETVKSQEPINPVASQPRKLIAMLELNTHGTEEQMWKTYEKLKFEINLQGFKVILSDEIQVRP